MKALELLENILPIIKADIDKIEIITSRTFEGSFMIKNIGGNNLEGKITSNLRGLEFYPLNFSGNRIKIGYKFCLNDYKKGDILESSVLIVSNGGEIIIPVLIKVVPPSIFSIDGEEINSLENFLQFTRKQPIEASRLFIQKEFSNWLVSMNYADIEVYNHFSSDINSKRGLDNFLVYNKLKTPAKVNVVTKNIKLKFKNTDKEPVTNVIPLKLEGWGYVDYKIDFSPNSQCVKLLTQSINQDDFDDNGFSDILFITYPSRLSTRYAYEKLTLVGDIDTHINIELLKEKQLDFNLSKESYGYEDNGNIIVNNYSGEELLLDIYAKDNFIKFQGPRYLVSDKAEIDFTIKMSPLQSAGYIIRKQPVIKSDVVIKTSISGKIIYKKLVLSIGKLV